MNESIQIDSWRKQWLTAIKELTSLAIQTQNWLDSKNVNPHHSFSEYMNYYFDDILSGVSYSDYIKKGWVSEAEVNCIMKWQ